MLAREPARVLRRILAAKERTDEDVRLLHYASQALVFHSPPLLNADDVAALEAAVGILPAATGAEALRQRVVRLRARLEDPDAWR